MVEPLRDRVLGRVVAEDVYAPGNDDEPIVTRNTLLDEALVEKLETAGVQIDQGAFADHLRSALRRLRARATAAISARGHLVNIGEAVGVIAAQSIGEPGTQLTMRTFHIGGAASRAAAVDNVQVKTHRHAQVQQPEDGAAQRRATWSRCRVRANCPCMDAHGRERERYKVPYGAIIDGQGRRGRSRPARPSRTGIRIRIRSFRKWPAWSASSTSSTASPCRSRPTS